jgi:hypothetical protein
MKRALIIVCLFLLTLNLADHARAQEANAQEAAESILRSLSNQEYRGVWDKKTSEWAHKNWSQDVFLSNMSMGRPQLGTLQGMQVIGREHVTKDPATGFEGDIYAITFKNRYSFGEFYERIVVIKDSDGQYRLSGISGSPVPSK